MFGTHSERASYRVKDGVEQVLREKPIVNKKEAFDQALTSESKYQRFLSVLRLLKASLPEGLSLSETTIKKLFYSSENLPFDPKQYDFEEENLGNGGQVRVYLLRSKTKSPSMAIKVFRPENKESHPAQLATRLRNERNEVGNLYSSVPDLVPIEHYIVMEDPFKKGRAAATAIEEFVAGEMFDIFSFSPEELSKIANENLVFRDQLIKFIEITIQNEIAEGKVIDITGPKNLIAVNINDGSFRLVLLDPHGHIQTKNNNDKIRAMVKEKLDFLKKVSLLIENMNVAA